ncbi:hypothetical protein ZHAS_00003458 [Anopheles sinensis]|uniref:Uncharacterized protein n=1 Tax=Anopheles sinensis TaxID=74873 RepID=A0A084VED9_ANOSI|nr:hypothetical protein ZHAS_00003458 [Anopheles sinensis]
MKETKLSNRGKLVNYRLPCTRFIPVSSVVSVALLSVPQPVDTLDRCTYTMRMPRCRSVIDQAERVAHYEKHPCGTEEMASCGIGVIYGQIALADGSHTAEDVNGASTGHRSRPNHRLIHR